jgi:DNA-binding GntR family transcriptional regulator
MKKAKITDISAPLIKLSLVTKLKEAIFSGRLKPGQRIIERYWAQEFDVAPTSVREAINLLINEGFATKDSGRSARVISYSSQDIARLYEVRGALEGLAARLLAQSGTDLSPLREALKSMKKAIQAKSPSDLLTADLSFHLQLCDLPGNEFLSHQAHTLLVPLFAFVATRVGKNAELTDAWKEDLERHASMLKIIEEGDPLLSELYVRHALEHFAARADEIWR